MLFFLFYAPFFTLFLAFLILTSVKFLILNATLSYCGIYFGNSRIFQEE